MHAAMGTLRLLEGAGEAVNAGRICRRIEGLGIDPHLG